MILTVEMFNLPLKIKTTTTMHQRHHGNITVYLSAIVCYFLILIYERLTQWMITLLKIFIITSGLFDEFNNYYTCLDVPISWHGWLRLCFKWHVQQQTKKRMTQLSQKKTKERKETNLKNQSEPMAP